MMMLSLGVVGFVIWGCYGLSAVHHGLVAETNWPFVGFSWDCDSYMIKWSASTCIVSNNDTVTEMSTT